VTLPLWQFFLTQRPHVPKKQCFGYRENDIRQSPDAPDLREIGAAAEGFMAAHSIGANASEVDRLME
jgi:hypothetical protein